MSEFDVFRIFAQITSALQICHYAKHFDLDVKNRSSLEGSFIVDVDLNPDNIMPVGQGVVKLINVDLFEFLSPQKPRIRASGPHGAVLVA